MDRSQTIGFIVLAAFILIYFWFFAPSAQEPRQADQPQQEQATTTPQEQQQDNTEPEVNKDQSTDPAGDTMMDDSVKNAQFQSRYGVFAHAAEGNEEIFTLENEKIKVEFSSKGGHVKRVVLKNYEDYNYEPLVLIDENSSDLQYLIDTPNGEIDLNELYYQEATLAEQKADTAGISFVLELTNGQRIRQTYYLPNDSYVLLQENDFDALDDVVDGDQIHLSWDYDMKRLEKDLEYNRDYSTINYYNAFDEFDDLSARSDELETETFTQPVKWLSFKQRFFTTGLIAHGQFDNGTISLKVNPEDTAVVKEASAKMDLPLSYFNQADGSFTYYFGPNDLKELKTVAPGFRENLYLGFPVVNLINKYLVITIFNLLEKVTTHYGIIIVILVLIIRLILSPLTYKSHKQMAKTKVLKPEIDALKEKHGSDMQKFQSEQMKLYQQVGVNPLSGCIPLLLQMPILLAMFQFIPHAIQLRHESLLWAEDLSIYDSILNLPFEIPFYGDHVSLFTILMTLSTVLITKANSQMTAVEGPMKAMQYMMPFIFMFVLNSFPAGLTFYYFVSNIVSFGQMTLIKRMVDEDKIKKILEDNRKKNANKKKSKFQMRLEEAMKTNEGTRKAKSRKK